MGPSPATFSELTHIYIHLLYVYLLCLIQPYMYSSIIGSVFRNLHHRQEMVEKANLTSNDKERMKAILALDNAIEFMSSEESDEGDREQTTGPPPRHVLKALAVGKNKAESIKADFDATYQTRMTKRQNRTKAKLSRVAGQNVSNRPVPKNLPLGHGNNPRVEHLCVTQWNLHMPGDWKSCVSYIVNLLFHTMDLQLLCSSLL